MSAFNLIRRFAFAAIIVGPVRSALAADSVVVFNEVHYHPVTNETANEWVELHNQMAIDIDLSAWRITGSIGFDFAEGTIIPGGGYLVVASNPSALQAATGATNVLGPFTGRLNNSDGRLNLRDRNDRLMDELDYRDGGKWPVAPDGSGATLAKRDRNSTSVGELDFQRARRRHAGHAELPRRVSRPTSVAGPLHRALAL